MTFSGVMAFILRFFSPNLIALQTYYVTVVEDRLIMSVKYYLPVSVLHFSPQRIRTLQRGLSAIAELLVLNFSFRDM